MATSLFCAAAAHARTGGKGNWISVLGKTKHVWLSPYTLVGVQSTAEPTYTAVLRTPKEVSGESCACVPISLFAVARTGMEGKWTPVLEICVGLNMS